MNKRFAAFANLFFSSINVVLTAVIGLVMVPLYLRYFDISTYGAWLASNGIISMVSVFESGISTVVTQKLALAYSNKDAVAFSNITGSGILLAFFIGLLISLVGIILAPFIPLWVQTPKDQYDNLMKALILTSIGNGFTVVFLTMGAIPQAWQRTTIPGLIGVVAFLLDTFATLAGIWSGLGIISLGLGSLVLSLVYVVGYSVYLISEWRKSSFPALSISTATIGNIYHETKMLLLAKIASSIGSNTEAFIAAIFISPQISAVLVLTGRIILILQMFLDRISSAVFAGFALLSHEHYRKSSTDALHELIMNWTIISGLGLGVGLAFTKPIISLWLGREAFGGMSLLLVLTVSAYFSLRKTLTSSLTIAIGQVRQTSLYLIVETFLRLLLLVLFAYILGLIGIPLAGAIASGGITLLLSYLLANSYKVKLQDIYMPGIYSFCLNLCIGFLWYALIPEASNWPMLGFNIALYGVLMITVTVLIEKEWKFSLKKSVKTIWSSLFLIDLKV